MSDLYLDHSLQGQIQSNLVHYAGAAGDQMLGAPNVFYDHPHPNCDWKIRYWSVIGPLPVHILAECPIVLTPGSRGLFWIMILRQTHFSCCSCFTFFKCSKRLYKSFYDVKDILFYWWLIILLAKFFSVYLYLVSALAA